MPCNHLIVLHSCPVDVGEVLPAASSTLLGMRQHVLQERQMPSVGSVLQTQDGTCAFLVVGHGVLPSNGVHAAPCCYLRSLVSWSEAQSLSYTVVRKGYALAWITLSDKGAAGQRKDESGPLIARMVAEQMPLCHEQGFLLPDEKMQLQVLLVTLASQGYDFIVTTGGTGLSPRDITPEATLAVIDKRLYGFEQAMTLCSLHKTPHGAISRAIAGTCCRSIIVNLPGSKKAVHENIAAILPAVPHALAKLQGDSVDCGS